MDELRLLTISELKEYKYYLIGKIKEYQHNTREIDKMIKKKWKEENDV